MIKTSEQAMAVQIRRSTAGKVGIARAVRRFMKRTGNEQLAMAMPVRRPKTDEEAG